MFSIKQKVEKKKAGGGKVLHLHAILKKKCFKRGYKSGYSGRFSDIER